MDILGIFVHLICKADNLLSCSVFCNSYNNICICMIFLSISSGYHHHSHTFPLLPSSYCFFYCIFASSFRSNSVEAFATSTGPIIGFDFVIAMSAISFPFYTEMEISSLISFECFTEIFTMKFQSIRLGGKRAR